jgi:hypothetical protein
MTAPPSPGFGQPRPPPGPPVGQPSASLLVRFGKGLREHPTPNAAVNVTLWSIFGLIWVLIITGVAVGQSPKSTPIAAKTGVLASVSSSQPGTSRPSSTSPPSSAPAVVRTTTKAAPSPAAPRPVEATGEVTVDAAGAVLPDPRRTPGATNPAVTQADIATTICVSGWTTTVRPSSSYTTALKERQLASGYAYHGDTATADYEEDHLISLELGGSPTSELNLWPEPYHTTDGARVKDTIENKLHSLVCSGTLSLATAQHAIATNWWSAYLTYVGAPSATHTTTAPAQPATTAPASTLTCTASMSNSNPAQYSTTDVIVHTAAGAGVTATAHYKTTNTTHTGSAASNGVATIAFSISRATLGYAVEVDVTVTRNAAARSCSTSFTPR